LTFILKEALTIRNFSQTRTRKGYKGYGRKSRVFSYNYNRNSVIFLADA
jgi:hypothetical protein